MSNRLFTFVHRIGVISLLTFSTVATGREAPLPGRYVGKVDNNGIITFSIRRDLKRLDQLRCRFSVTDLRLPPESVLPRTFTVSFSSQDRDFPMGIGPRYGFNIDGRDSKTRTEYFVSGRHKRRGLVKGDVQFYQSIPVQYFNTNSGKVETITAERGLDGLHFFTARNVRSAARRR